MFCFPRMAQIFHDNLHDDHSKFGTAVVIKIFLVFLNDAYRACNSLINIFLMLFFAIAVIFLKIYYSTLRFFFIFHIFYIPHMFWDMVQNSSWKAVSQLIVS